MFKRKLTALGYHNPENFNVNDENEFRNVVVWLEDQKIRFYKIEDREDLRNINHSNWESVFKQYLKHVECPFDLPDRNAVIDWLLSFSVRLEYGDSVEKYKDATAENAEKNLVNAPQVIQENPLDNLDFEDKDFKAGVSTLARLLNITEHPDHLVTLKAICTLVKNRLSVEAVSKKEKPQGKPFPLQKSSLTFDTGDYVMNQAAKVLRLLYIHDLRDLQTRINEAIVAVQTITANPKTDTKLGRVGR
ncbi:RNA transcription, translation and transport factor protein [Tachypleus tridentatus]|uniref:RNA transcription, translation and transport factor protein n=1 Tax=Tachypleus tridentatus TaxID=6853 RepID=UPI003FD3F03B